MEVVELNILLKQVSQTLEGGNLCYRSASRPLDMEETVLAVVLAVVLVRNSVPMTVPLTLPAVFLAQRLGLPVSLRQTLQPVLPVRRLGSVIFGTGFLFQL